MHSLQADFGLRLTAEGRGIQAVAPRRALFRSRTRLQNVRGHVALARVCRRVLRVQPSGGRGCPVADVTEAVDCDADGAVAPPDDFPRVAVGGPVRVREGGLVGG